MATRVSGIFGANFQRKRTLRSSCLVLGCLEPRPVWVENRVSFHVPSRLKGIETGSICLIHEHASLWLSMYLPVWRELKPFSIALRSPPSKSLSMYLPVWRELKHYRTCCVSSSWLEFFPCTFPFEGNWNRIAKLYVVLLFLFAFHVPSRLKGIETLQVP